MKKAFFICLLLLPTFSLNSGWIPFANFICNLTVETSEMVLDPATGNVEIIPLKQVSVYSNGVLRGPLSNDAGISNFTLVESGNPRNYTISAEKPGYFPAHPKVLNIPALDTKFNLVLISIDNLKMIENYLRNELSLNNTSKVKNCLSKIKAEYPYFDKQQYFYGLHLIENEVSNLSTVKNIASSKADEDKVTETPEKAIFPSETPALSDMASSEESIFIRDINRYISSKRAGAAQDLLNQLKKSKKDYNRLTVNRLQRQIDAIKP